MRFGFLVATGLNLLMLLFFANSYAIDSKIAFSYDINSFDEIKELQTGCKAPERGPIGPVGPPGPSAVPLFASYSLPWPPGATDVHTNDPLPFVTSGLNASFPAVGGIVLNPTTHIFTIPEDGFYEISYEFSSFWASGTIVGLGIFTGGGTFI